MAREIKLTERLAAIARCVPPGGTVADIGTDHGFIPVYLAQTGAAARIIASDIRKGPLESAKRTAEAYGVSDRLEFVLAPGLDGVPENGADTVIIAGMGAETIISVLDAAPWTKNVRLVLQPQTKTELLLDWLRENGFAVTDALLVKDAYRLYVVLLAGGGEDAGGGLAQLLYRRRDPLFSEYAALTLKKWRKQLLGRMKGEGIDGNSQ